MIKKAIDGSFKDTDLTKGIVCGYFSHFGSKDYDNDVIVKGSYARTIQDRGVEGKNLIAHLLDHDNTKAIGRITLLKEDDIGLYYESKVGRHTLGRDFLLMVEDGIIKNHSVGFNVISEHDDHGVNYITEINLLEGSSLQFLGANENTPIVGIKSLDAMLKFLDDVEVKLRSAKYSDEAIISIKEKIDSMHVFLKEQGAVTNEVKSPYNLYLNLK